MGGGDSARNLFLQVKFVEIHLLTEIPVAAMRSREI